MADALSIASGVAGLVSLGLTLCDGLTTYFSAIRDRSKDIEMASQSLTLLRFHIGIIHSRKLAMSHQHPVAAHGVQLGLKSCESRLKALETFIQDLTSASDTSEMERRWNKKLMIAGYPFNQKKLAQLQGHLLAANNTLSSFVQTLNFDLNVSMSDELHVVRQDLSANHTTTNRMLETITSQLDCISLAVQRTNETIPQTSTGSQGRAVALKSSQTAFIDSQSFVMQLSPKLTDFKSNELAQMDLQPAYQRNAQAEIQAFSRLEPAKYTCSCPRGGYTRRLTRKTYRLFGNLTISKQEHTQASHSPGCFFFEASSRTNSTTTSTYFGYLSVLSMHLAISLSQQHEARSYNLSFGLRPNHVVKTSPAFDLFKWERSKTTFAINQPIESTRQLIQDLTSIYGGGLASIFDVNRFGRNIAQTYLYMCCNFLGAVDEQEVMIDAACMMLSFMCNIGIPDIASIFDICFEHPLGLAMLPRIYSWLTQHDPNFCPPEIAHSEIDWDGGWSELEHINALQALGDHPIISQEVGLEGIFLAVLQKDEQDLIAALNDPKRSPGVSRKDLYGRNILHVSSGWADGLSLLLQHEPARNLLNQPSWYGLHPLDHALIHSRALCSEPDQFTICHNCGCFLAVKVLLEADCSVVVGTEQVGVLEECSLKARILFFEHLQSRRERLRDVALKTLDTRSLSVYEITASSLPDATAMIWWDEIENRVANSNEKGIQLSEGLKPYDQLAWSTRGGFFSFPHRLEVALLAKNYGLEPIDEPGIPTLLSRIHFFTGFTSLRGNLLFMDWLLEHDLAVDISMGPFRSSALHRFGWWLGYAPRYSPSIPTKLIYPEFEFRKHRRLFSALLSSSLESDLPCPCLSGTFNRPLSSLLSGFVRSQCHRGEGYCIEKSKQDACRMSLLLDLLNDCGLEAEKDYVASCAIHSLTMGLLGVRHIPLCDELALGGYMEWDVSDYEEGIERLDEDEHLIKKLHTLDREFFQEFQRQDVSINEFLQGHWISRMAELEEEMSGPLSDDYRSALDGVGVVLEDGELTNSDTDSDCEAADDGGMIQ